MDISSLRERSKIGVYTVKELNEYIKRLIEGDRSLGAVTVNGEISNFTHHSSGHMYFTLKDDGSQIRAIMFRSAAEKLKFKPEAGMKVIIHGEISVFTRDGAYQLYASSMQPDGIGALYLAYEQLRKRLADEGLFDGEHKKSIPKFPRRIGVITSPTGAAIRDIINVSGRRYPVADLYLYPAIVQGANAVPSLVRAIDYFEESGLVDLIIIGRGGGSIEDLWAFNDELLARRIFKAKTPIISAVGHETDYTICDFVADLRAPTPSAGAEIAVPDLREIALRIDNSEQRCLNALLNQIDDARGRIEKYSACAMSDKIFDRIYDERELVSDSLSSAQSLIQAVIDKYRAELSVLAGKADSLSPLSVLSRGYTVTMQNESTVENASDVRAGADISVLFHDGSVNATVKEIKLNGQ